MKILIVDNEKHVIDAIQMLIRWDSYPIAEIFIALSGKEAIEIIDNHHPDLILTDMKMPNMGGMELIEWIKENCRNAQIIVISGYSDFTFIQHTLRHGGLDYITKPIDEEQLNHAIQKAVDIIHAEQKLIVKEIQSRKSNLVYWERIFSMVVDTPLQHSTELVLIKEYFGLTTGDQIQIATIQIQALSVYLAAQFQSDMNLFYFAVKNICQEIIEKEHVDAYIFGKEGMAGRIQILFWNDLRHIRRTTQQLMSGLVAVFERIFHIGVSKVHIFPKEVADADLESHEAIAQRNLLDYNAKVHFYTEMNNPREFYFKDIAEEILLSIQGHNRELIHNLLEKVFGAMEKKSYVSEKTMVELQEEYRILRNYWVQVLFDNQDVPEDEFSIHISTMNNTHDLTIRKMKQVIQEDIEKILYGLIIAEEEKSNGIYMIKKYIDGHYKENISLSMLAKMFYRSKEHLSRTFKKTFLMTLSEYLTALRMEKAKVLLGNENLTLKDIAQSVGYEDEKYFSKVFRQKYSLSPNEYRNKVQ